MWKKTKSIVCVLLIVLLVGCNKQITQDEKKQVINKFTTILKSGDLAKLEDVVNVKVSYDFSQHTDIEKTAFLKVLFSDLEITYKNDAVDIKNYPATTLIEKAKMINRQIEGRDIEEKTTDKKAQEQQYLESMQSVKNDLDLKKVHIPIKFVEEDKKVKLDFSDPNTKKIYLASIGSLDE